MQLPEELKALRQWCVAGPDGKGGYKAPYTCNLQNMASSTDPTHWGSFDEAMYAASAHPGCGVGFMLSANDPYACIDLDVKDDTTEEQLQRYQAIIKAFSSYTELSQSGKGFHIWVRGSIGSGARRDGVEVYSQERFIVCTGNAIHAIPIADQQELLAQLVTEIRRAQNPQAQTQHVDEPERHTDSEIVNMLSGAVNADKFNDLCVGDWSAMGYPSQSEADLALMSMFTFHSGNNDQCKRLFRMSGLGKRDKAIKNDRYLDRTLAIIRGRQVAENAVEQVGERLAAELLAAFQVREPEPTPLEAHPAPVNYQVPALTVGVVPAQFQFPPGFVGRLAESFYKAAPRPVKEVATVAALGLMAGLCGKGWNIPGSGLNLYLILIGRSATGKEALHSSIANLLHRFAQDNLSIGAKFVDFSDYASAPALVKASAANPCFVNVVGEFGRKLKRMANENADTSMQQLRTVMTNLYQKSAYSSIVGGIGYSQKDNSVASVTGVSYSIIGESTPDTFYESLTDSMMSDGFLSRFTMVEYSGDRPPLNLDTSHKLDDHSYQYFGALITQAAKNASPGMVPTMVTRDEFAAAMLDAFDLECDVQINSTWEEPIRQMWNRAHLKACRIAALLAIGDNYVNPVVTAAHVDWAVALIRKDITIMGTRYHSGDIGVGDHPRETKVLTVCAEYIKHGAPPSYMISPQMVADQIIPRKYLQIRTQRASAFTAHRNGVTAALNSTIQSLIDSGYISEVPATKLANYGYSGKCYKVLTIPPQILKAVLDSPDVK